jgi:hypothetical protein
LGAPPVTFATRRAANSVFSSLSWLSRSPLLFLRSSYALRPAAWAKSNRGKRRGEKGGGEGESAVGVRESKERDETRRRGSGTRGWVVPEPPRAPPRSGVAGLDPRSRPRDARVVLRGETLFARNATDDARERPAVTRGRRRTPEARAEHVSMTRTSRKMSLRAASAARRRRTRARTGTDRPRNHRETLKNPERASPRRRAEWARPRACDVAPRRASHEKRAGGRTHCDDKRERLRCAFV